MNNLPPQRASLSVARLDHSTRKWVTPFAILIGVMSAYIVCLTLILCSSTPIALLLALPCGLFIGQLFIIGHDACHQSYTPSALVNNALGRFTFLPSLHSFSLWDLGHNKTHHRYNNIRKRDYVWEPMAPEEFKEASSLRKLAYRFSRSWIGVPFYYGCAIWAPKMVLPLPSVVGAVRKVHLLDTALVLGFLVVQAIAVVQLGAFFGKSALSSLVLGIVCPFLVWNGLMSAVIYLHHTHPDVGWYGNVDAWTKANGKVRGTVHVKFPLIMRVMMLEITEHNAHHYAPGVPLYNLTSMQHAMGAENAVEWNFSLSEYFRICRECKLFDYATSKWVPFPV
jgi:omega-6 fatty acid desaturase (delta-12 desaturase)